MFCQYYYAISINTVERRSFHQVHRGSIIMENKNPITRQIKSGVMFALLALTLLALALAAAAPACGSCGR